MLRKGGIYMYKMLKSSKNGCGGTHVFIGLLYTRQVGQVNSSFHEQLAA